MTPNKALSKTQLLIIGIAIICVLIPISAIPQEKKSVPLNITILHTNDLHAHDEPFQDHGRQVGGLARIGYLIHTIKKHQPNTIAIDAGDIFQGTPIFNLYHGQTEVALLNSAGYDIYTIGNHEFDNGPDNLATQLKEAKFDIISCNLDASAVPQLAKLIRPSVVKTIGGQQVGFVGAITPDLEHISLSTGGVKVKLCPNQSQPNHSQANSTFDDWICPIQQEVDRLKSAGINKIILVTHCGIDLDRQLAEALPNVDVIVGGHSHTRLDQPEIVKHSGGAATMIVQTGCYGKALGKLCLCFDANGHIDLSTTQYHLINITDRIPEDPTMHEYVSDKEKPLSKLKTTILCYARKDFDNQFKKYPGDSPIGDLICDALADAGTDYGATISLQNRGGIRSRIEHGPVSMEEIEEILPFENHLVLATISGSTLLRILEHSLSGSSGSKFLDVHGLKVTYDSAKPVGSKIISALAEEHNKNWQPVNPLSQYKIAVNSFTFAGGEGYEFLGATNVKTLPLRLSEIVENYLQKHHEISPMYPNRLFPVE